MDTPDHPPSPQRSFAASVGRVIVALSITGAVVLVLLALTRLIRLSPDPVFQSRASAVLIVALVLELVTILLHRFGVGLALYPPRLRLRLELESIMLELLGSIRFGTSPATLADRLARLRRRTFTRAWRARLANWHDRLRRDDPTCWRRTADEMATALGDFATGAGRRLPIGRPAMLLAQDILAGSAKIAVIGALFDLLAPAAPLISFLTLLELVVLFAAALALLRLVRFVSCKCHDIRTKAQFRTIFVTDRARLGLLASVAVVLLYSRIGHVVIISATRRPDEAIMPDALGAYYCSSLDGGLEDALAAYSPHCDLIVLDTADQALASEVRARTALPPDRYRALSEDGSAPKNYLWIDPRTLLILPYDRRARDADIDPYLWGIRRGPSVFRDWWLFFFVAGVILFAGVEHAEPLSAFFLVAAIARAVPEWIGHLRLGAIDRARLRVPANPDVSRALDPPRLGRNAWLAVGAAYIAATAWFALRTGFHPELDRDPTGFAIMAILYLLLFAGPTLVVGLLLLRKWTLDWRFRILVLRRNSSVFGYGHKAHVMATCGKYGQVVSLHDYALDLTDEGTGEWRESSLGPWFQTFSEVDHTLLPDTFFHVWQRQVLIELEVVDFAVFDWVEDVTDNMQWELSEALRHLPSHRVLIICAPPNEAATRRFLASCLPSNESQPHLLLLARDRDDQYIWGDHRHFDACFGKALHEALVALNPEARRTPAPPSTGAWAYPRPAERGIGAGPP